MLIKLDNRYFEVSDPRPGPDELVIQVGRYIVIQSPASSKNTRFNFKNIFSKFMFFLLHEGPRLTFYKVKATLLHKKIIEEHSLVYAYGFSESEQKYYACIGPQDSPSAGLQVFPGDFCTTVKDQKSFEEKAQIITAYLSEHTLCLDYLFNYSKYSGVAPGFNLRMVFEEAAQKDIGLTNNKIFNALTVGSHKQKVLKPRNNTHHSSYDLFVAGAGAYVFAYILPLTRGIRNHTVIDLNPVLAASVGSKFKFLHWETSCNSAFSRLNTCKMPILVVATYHSTHYDVLKGALVKNPETRVFLEKPPVTSAEQLEGLIKIRQKGHDIEIGYNRRYSPMINATKKILAGKTGQITMTCIVKELKIPLQHWYYWPSQGTRITGNLCHWIDLGTFFIEATPVYATIALAANNQPGDEVTIVINYEDGSRLTLMSTDNGNSLRGVQEFIDIRQADITVSIDDYLRMRVQQGGHSKTRRTIVRDKGHERMYRMYIKRISCGKAPYYPNRDLYISSMLYLSIVDAARNGCSNVKLNFPLLSSL